jgi:hypothetical protein
MTEPGESMSGDSKTPCRQTHRERERERERGETHRLSSGRGAEKRSWQKYARILDRLFFEVGRTARFFPIIQQRYQVALGYAGWKDQEQRQRDRTKDRT